MPSKTGELSQAEMCLSLKLTNDIGNKAMWKDEHISKGMLKAQLDPTTDAASRNKEYAAASIAWIISKFKINNGSRIIDFGCGAGLYTTALAEAGAEVKGVDFSERSINYARGIAKEKGLKIDYFLKDYLEFSIDCRFDLITLIWWDFGVSSPEQRDVLLRKFRDLLEAGGSVLLDVDSMVRFRKTVEEGTEYVSVQEAGFFSPLPHHIFTTKFKYEQNALSLEKQVIIGENREWEFYHWAQCYSSDTLKKEFEENGLSIIEYNSDVAGKPYADDSPVMAVVTEKST